ncbi:hypothetical protein [Nonomuraea dietziae]|uniref:hypothetical protein n=1 Tax=Nonomuraea dietziae TaxID=65515 RepID=UPI0031CDAEC1
MYIPSSLKAHDSFTHIMQTRCPAPVTGPITVTSLRQVTARRPSSTSIFEQDILVGRTDLVPLQNRWIDIEYEIKIGRRRRARSDGSSERGHDRRHRRHETRRHLPRDRVRKWWHLPLARRHLGIAAELPLLLTDLRA